MRYAFKEWGAICSALGQGKQTLILRKGGIHDESGLFRPEHTHFWLFPTAFHQPQPNALKPEAEQLANDFSPIQLQLQYFVEVDRIDFIETEPAALALDEYHLWSEETIRKRFHYRQPGLFALWVRVYQAKEMHTMPMNPAWDGCKTWVDLGKELQPTTAKAALSDQQYNAIVAAARKSLNLRLG